VVEKNSPYYSDVEIDSQNLDLLPDDGDGDVYLECRGYDSNDNSTVECSDIEGVHYLSYSDLNDEELEGIDLKDVPSFSGISQKHKVGHSFDSNVLCGLPLVLHQLMNLVAQVT